MSQNMPEEPRISDQIFYQDGRAVASYYPLSSDYADKQVIFFERGELTKLRRFDTLKLSTMTSIVYIDGQIYNMDSLYNLLACFPCNTGVPRACIAPGTLMSVRWGDDWKGEEIGHFQHSICGCLYNGRKDIKFKISRKSDKNKKKGDRDSEAPKLQITGADIDTAREAAEMITAQMRAACDFYDCISMNTKEYEEVIIGLVTSPHGPAVGQHFFDDNSHVDRHIVWPNNFPDRYQKLATSVIQRCTDLKYVSQIVPRAKKILEDGRPCTPGIGFYSVKRAMSKYNYNLGFEVNRLKLAQYLIELGYAACFFNEIVEYVFVPIPDEIVDTEGTVRREVGRDNQFEIYASGKIKHSGTGALPMEDTYTCLLLDMIKGVDRFAIWKHDKYSDGKTSRQTSLY